jgi:hypothetical protein
MSLLEPWPAECPTCMGSGHADEYSGSDDRCPECHGSGEVVVVPEATHRGGVDRVAELEAELAKVRESRDAWRLQAMREHDADR